MSQIASIGHEHGAALPVPMDLDRASRTSAPAFSPVALVLRLMRGRWLAAMASALALSAALSVAGYYATSPEFEGRVILRIAAREPSILYANADDSRLKLFDDFVRSEATFVASRPVMQAAADILNAKRHAGAERMTALSVTHAVDVRRKDALLIITATGATGEAAAATANAVLEAYQDAHARNAARRSTYREQELATRESDLYRRLREVNARILQVGGEYGANSLAKAHISKVASIEALEARRGEVRASMAALEAKDTDTDVDTGDDLIKRAVLLDRALADLSFEKAKQEAELAGLLVRATEKHPPVISARAALDVIDAAITARRDQIVTLARTGALKDAEGSEEQSLAAIRRLLSKIDSDIAAARKEARALNAKRVELTFLEEERAEVRRLLDETRRALDIVRVESRNALPGIIEVISNAMAAPEPADDKRLVLGAAGALSGGGAGLFAFFALGLLHSRVRYSDDLTAVTHARPLLATLPAPRRRADAREEAETLRRAANIIRNAMQLHPMRLPPREGAARTIMVAGAGLEAPLALATALATSFAASGLKSILVDADLTSGALSARFDAIDIAGMRDALQPDEVVDLAPRVALACGTMLVPVGTAGRVCADTVSVPAMRRVMNALTARADVVIVHTGSVRNALLRDTVAAEADLALAVIDRGTARTQAARTVDRIDALTRGGVVLAFQNARRDDPGLAAAI